MSVSSPGSPSVFALNGTVFVVREKHGKHRPRTHRVSNSKLSVTHLRTVARLRRLRHELSALRPRRQQALCLLLLRCDLPLGRTDRRSNATGALVRELPFRGFGGRLGLRGRCGGSVEIEDTRPRFLVEWRGGILPLRAATHHQ